MELMEVLSSCGLFASIDREDLEQELVPLGRVREVLKSQDLIVAQEKVDSLGIILSGQVRLMHLFADGSCNLMGFLRKGQLLGADLVSTQTRQSPYFATADTPAEIFYLQADDILKPGRLLEPVRLQVVQNLLMQVANENIRKEYRLAILSQRGLRDRIMIYLRMQAGKRGGNVLTLPMSREEMASFLCVNRSALSHELSRMEQEGLISFHKNVFTLHMQETETRVEGVT